MPETTQQDPIEKVYKAVVDKGLFTGSVNDFKKKYSYQKSIDELYNDVKVGGLYTGDKFGFYEKYFPEKREDAAYERLHGAFKKAGYEGSDKDFRDQYRDPESIKKMYALAKQNEMFTGDEETFVNKYFPSKVKKKETGTGSFGFGRTDFQSAFTEKQKKDALNAPPTATTSPQVQKKSSNIFGEEVDIKPSGKELQGTSSVDPDYIEAKKAEKLNTEHAKIRKEIYKKKGKWAGRLYDVNSTIQNAGSSFANRAMTIPADALDAIAAGAHKLDQAGVALGIIDEAKDIDEYATRKAAVGIRKFANDIAPQDPYFQDDLINALAGTAPDLIAAALTGGTTKAATYFATTGMGQGFDQALNAYQEMDKDLEGYIASRTNDPQEAEALREGYRRYKESGDSAADAAFKVGVKEGAIQIIDVLPMAKYFKKLDKYTGGSFLDVLNKKGGQFMEKIFEGAADSKAGKIVTQGLYEGTTEVVQQALSNLNAASSYEASRNITQGMEMSGEAGGVMGMLMEVMLGHKVKARNNTTDPVERAIIDADIAQLQEKKAEYDANPEQGRPEQKQKEELADALEEDISPEAEKAINEKLSTVGDPKKDTGELAPFIEKQYDEKIAEIEKDMDMLPETVQSTMKEKIKELEAEKKAAIERVYPEGVKKQPKKKTLEEELEELAAKPEEPVAEKPSLEKQLEELAAKPEEGEIISDREKYVRDYYEGAKQDMINRGNWSGFERERLIKESIKDLKAAKENKPFDNFLLEEGYQTQYGRKVIKEPTAKEIKAQEEAAIEMEQEAELKKAKPEVKMEFMQRADLRKAKDIEGVTKEHTRIKDEYKEVRKIIDCLWA